MDTATQRSSSDAEAASGPSRRQRKKEAASRVRVKHEEDRVPIIYRLSQPHQLNSLDHHGAASSRPTTSSRYVNLNWSTQAEDAPVIGEDTDAIAIVKSAADRTALQRLSPPYYEKVLKLNALVRKGKELLDALVSGIEGGQEREAAANQDGEGREEGGVVIECGLNGSGWVSVYGHAGRLMVTGGQAVKRGQTIALSGESGFAGRPALHFELRKNRVPVDPVGLLRGG